MALADLKDVANRLRDLNTRLNRVEGREVGQQEIAEKAGVKYRTFQTWLAAERENTDGEGYEKLARFYRRKLDDKTITRNWIIWGQSEPPKMQPVGAIQPQHETIVLTEADLERLDRIEEEQRQQRDLLEEILRRLPPEEGPGEPGEPGVPPDEPVPPPPTRPPGEEGTGEAETG